MKCPKCGANQLCPCESCTKSRSDPNAGHFYGQQGVPWIYLPPKECTFDGKKEMVDGFIQCGNCDFVLHADGWLALEWEELNAARNQTHR